MSVTPFAKTGEVDEQALRELLRGFISLNFGVLLGSGGEGEGHALEPDEARRIYEIGVEECAGKVPVYANLPEEMTARATIQRAQLAVDAGIDVIHIYTIEGRHGMKPSDAELMTYFDDVFAIVKRPVGIAINAGIGYIAKAEIIADVCHRHPQVVELRLTHVPDTYFIKLKSMVRRPTSSPRPAHDLSNYVMRADMTKSVQCMRRSGASPITFPDSAGRRCVRSRCA